MTIAELAQAELAPAFDPEQANQYDWCGHYSASIAFHHAEILRRVTGDTYMIARFGCRYRIIRVDPSGKEVEVS